MKLNRQQRFTAYCIMLAESTDIDHEGGGLCLMAKKVLDIDTYGANQTLCTVFPELKKYKPLEKAWWWPCDRYGWIKRKEVLKKCISETA